MVAIFLMKESTMLSHISLSVQPLGEVVKVASYLKGSDALFTSDAHEGIPVSFLPAMMNEGAIDRPLAEAKKVPVRFFARIAVTIWALTSTVVRTSSRACS
jgi:hypothetical protein